MKAENKNRFAGMKDDDSDDEASATAKVTKTQKKKDERAIAEKPKQVKVNVTEMAKGGFQVLE